MYIPTAGAVDLGSASKEEYINVTPNVKPKVYQDNDKVVSYAPTFQPSLPQLMETLVACNLKGLMPKAVVQNLSGDVTQYRSFIRSLILIV